MLVATCRQQKKKKLQLLWATPSYTHTVRRLRIDLLLQRLNHVESESCTRKELAHQRGSILDSTKKVSVLFIRLEKDRKHSKDEFDKQHFPQNVYR